VGLEQVDEEVRQFERRVGTGTLAHRAKVPVEAPVPVVVVEPPLVAREPKGHKLTSYQLLEALR